MKDFCKTLPKVELHAHLNGCLKESTIQKLCHLKNAPHLYDNWQRAINHGENRTLAECFEMFDAVHALTTCSNAIKLATSDVLNDMEEDGVIYLELRSTPREVPGVMTKMEYVDSIIESIKEHKGKMIVKLLVSINRRDGPMEAENTLKIALSAREKHPNIVCGLDLSGDPRAGLLSHFLPTLKSAKEKGLAIVLHCGEVPNEEEVMEMIKLRPNRLGHATCIHPQLGGNLKQWNALLESRIPVEICLTSNIKCLTIPSYDAHQFKYLYEANHPITLSTDDKGVFCTDLSHEYYLAAKTFSLTEKQLIDLSMDSIDFCLASDDEKLQLKIKFKNYLNEECH